MRARGSRPSDLRQRRRLNGLGLLRATKAFLHVRNLTEMTLAVRRNEVSVDGEVEVESCIFVTRHRQSIILSVAFPSLISAEEVACFVKSHRIALARGSAWRGHHHIGKWEVGTVCPGVQHMGGRIISSAQHLTSSAVESCGEC